MLKFKRLSDLSKDEKVIVEALKKSKAGLLEVSEDGSKIRRDPAIPLPENTEESRKLLEARTAYAKGFNKESTTLDELLDYYNESNTDVVSIQMRNYCEKKGKEKVWKFKGSIFLTFKTEDAAKAFVARRRNTRRRPFSRSSRKTTWKRRRKRWRRRRTSIRRKIRNPKPRVLMARRRPRRNRRKSSNCPRALFSSSLGLVERSLGRISRRC